WVAVAGGGCVGTPARTGPGGGVVAGAGAVTIVPPAGWAVPSVSVGSDVLSPPRPTVGVAVSLAATSSTVAVEVAVAVAFGWALSASGLACGRCVAVGCGAEATGTGAVVG